MDTPTIRHLRSEWLAIGTAPPSSAACHRLAHCEPVVDALVPGAMIEALIPGVLASPRRFDLAEGPWCDLDAFLADAVSALWELTTKWTDTHCPFAAGDLLSGVRIRLRTLQTRERRHRSRQSGNPAALDAVPASIGRTGEELLAAALAETTGHGLIVSDAAVLYATGVLGISLTEVAELAELPRRPSPALAPEHHRSAGRLTCV